MTRHCNAFDLVINHVMIIDMCYTNYTKFIFYYYIKTCKTMIYIAHVMSGLKNTFQAYIIKIHVAEKEVN